jgi:hypothetical protein
MPTIKQVKITTQDEEIGARYVQANSRFVVGRFCGREFSIWQRCNKLQRTQKIQSIGSDRKDTEQVSRQSERAPKLLLPPRQMVGVLASQLTPHAQLM